MDRTLFELQEGDNAIARIKRERAKLDNGATLRAERDKIQKQRDAAAAALKDATTRRSEQEDELTATEDKIKRSQARLMTAKTSHEVTALERDIKGLSARRGEFDEIVLELMDEVETATSALAKLEAELSEKSTETARVEAQFKLDAARLDKELAAATAQRAELAAAVEPKALAKYTDVAAKHHGVAVAHVEKGNCSSCGMAFTLHNLREAKGEEWPTCENCSRLLFIE